MYLVSEHAYTACLSTSIHIPQPSIVKNLRFKIILELGIVFLLKSGHVFL